MPLRVLALGLHRKFHADPKPRYCLIARKMWDPRLSAVSPAIADLNAKKLKGGESLGECGPGGDLLFRRLSGSTIGAEGFHGRVRDEIGCLAPRYGHQACRRSEIRGQRSGGAVP